MIKYVLGNFILLCISFLLLAFVSFATMDQGGDQIDRSIRVSGILMAVISLIYNFSVIASSKKSNNYLNWTNKKY
jgi:succinate-acetate transporter protein